VNHERKICRIAEKIAAKGKNIILAGAGISTESGIADCCGKAGPVLTDIGVGVKRLLCPADSSCREYPGSIKQSYGAARNHMVVNFSGIWLDL